MLTLIMYLLIVLIVIAPLSKSKAQNTHESIFLTTGTTKTFDHYKRHIPPAKVSVSCPKRKRDEHHPTGADWHLLGTGTK